MKIKARTLFFLGCEGASEMTYGKFIERLARKKGLHVTMPPYDCKGGDPEVIANKSIEESIRVDNSGHPSKAKFLLLDSDRLDGMNRNDVVALKKLLKSNNFITIWQKFDHEGFLLRHFSGHENDCPPRGHTLEALKKVWPKYEKGSMDIEDYQKRITLDDVKRVAKTHPDLESLIRTIGLVGPKRSPRR